jgi:CubicO group peptidase (beta-lactamase class C family)
MKASRALLIAITILLTTSVCAQGDRPGVAEKIDQYMARVTAKGFSGALLVATGGKVLMAKGYGMSDRARGIPVTPTTVFTVGSITKQFTAAAILKLQEMGKLRVQDHLSRYFADVPPDKAGITLHHLLTHTAGFPGAIGDDFEPVDRKEFVALALHTPLLFAPGERYEYSNVGYSLLGAIIEQLTGQPYERFLRQHLFLPAGMTETGYAIPSWPEGQLAHGYRGSRDWGTLRDYPWASDGPYWHLRANGGMLSTVGDLYKWHIALESGRVLPDSLRQLLYNPFVREGPDADSYYGYGWSISTTRRGTRLVSHNGGNGIFSADFLRFLDENVVIICMGNAAGWPAWQVTETVARIVFGEEYELPAERAEPLPLPTLANSPMGAHALAFVALLGKADTAAVAEALSTHFADSYQQPERRRRLMAFVQRVASNQGPLTLVKAEKTGDATIELTAKSQQTGEWWLLTMDFEKRAPYRIAGLRMVDVAPELQQE